MTESFPLWRDMTPEDAQRYLDETVKKLDPLFHKIVTEAEAQYPRLTFNGKPIVFDERPGASRVQFHPGRSCNSLDCPICDPTS